MRNHAIRTRPHRRIGRRCWRRSPSCHPIFIQSRSRACRRRSATASTPTASGSGTSSGGARGMPKSGPAPVSMYSPGAAEPIQVLNQYLRKTVAGGRYFELSALLAAREFDQQYEWSGHEPAALRAGLEQAVIDVVKFNRDVAGLPEKDATVIRLGRALFRDHKVSSELWAKTVEFFGRQGAIEIVATMGDYTMAGFMLTAVDQQLPPDRKPMLPPR